MKTINDKTVSEKIQEIGMTIEEVREWLKAENNQASLDNTLIADADESVSNVVFIPGKKTKETRVYVDDAEIEGLIRAHLEYDAELNFPILKLEILNPYIGIPSPRE